MRFSRLLFSTVLLLAPSPTAQRELLEPAVDVLLSRFPGHAAEVLSRSVGFHRHGGQFVPASPARLYAGVEAAEVALAERGWFAAALPALGEGALDIGTGEFHVRVRELGARGPGRAVEKAVVFDRPDGFSYWSSSVGGVEEWLLVRSIDAEEPVARWQVEGATLAAVGAAVELRDRAGIAHIRVTAPRAYDAAGAPLPVRLAVQKGQLVLFADAQSGKGPFLIDPAWQATGTMTSARNKHTATLLQSGKVLVAGGFHNMDPPQASAEVYDPATGVWTATGSMTTARAVHAATLLTSGKVLVAGGEPLTASAELYDPATGTWTATGSMTTMRQLPTATLLLTRKVLVAGGMGAFPLASAELYDPMTGTWTATPPMSSAREFHTATLLVAGQVLVTGGIGMAGSLASAEIYEPLMGAWSSAGSMALARENHTATLLQSGKVLVVGGAPDTRVDLYDPNAGWSLTGSALGFHVEHTASLLGSGQVLVAGGSGMGGSTSLAEIYDPAGTWSRTAFMSTGRSEHTATVLNSGKVLVAGGFDGFSPLLTAELFDPSGCSSDADCAAGNYCNAAGACVATKMAAAACNPAVDCKVPASCHECGILTCVGGVCVLPAGCTRDADCGAGQYCSAATSSCASQKGAGVACGSDCKMSPCHDCATTSTSSCGADGKCIAGACEAWPVSTACSAPTCSDSTTVSVKYCSGAGSCSGPTTQSCSPYDCASGSCKTTCSADTDCAAGNFCDASAECVAVKASGSSCNVATDCKVPGNCAECGALACVAGQCASITACAADATCGANAYCEASGFCAAAKSAGGSCGPADCKVPATCTECVSGYACVSGSCQAVMTMMSGAPSWDTAGINKHAAVGVPYAVNLERALSASGMGPFTFTKVAGPDGLFVDPSTGTVSWQPTVAGMFSITVSAMNAAGTTPVTFSVDVSDSKSGVPTAVLTATPQSGIGPLMVTLSTAGAAAAPSGSLLGEVLDFGDGSPRAFVPPGGMVNHRYALAGGYVARATAIATNGEEAQADAFVVVSDAAGSPPTCMAATATVTGPNMVNFAVQCVPGSSPVAGYLWDFSDGPQSQSSDPSPTHTFTSPGTYETVLYVTDQQGYVTTERIPVTVGVAGKLAPLLAIEASPPSGDASLAISLFARPLELGGNVTSVAWAFGDRAATQAAEGLTTDKTYAQAGAYVVRCTVTFDSGLIATDSLTVLVTSAGSVPPQILSSPVTTAKLGTFYHYSVVARGRDLVWAKSAGPPEFNIDPAGKITWKPSKSGDQPITLMVSSGKTMATQSFTVHVVGTPAATGCGCSTASSPGRAALSVAVLALLALVRLRRRQAACK